jgi:pimeloyl-ACP methyl ester carboxylesterase
MRLDRSWIGILSFVSLFGASVPLANASWKPAAVRQFRKLEEKVRHYENDELQAIRSSAKVDLSAPLRTLRFRKQEFRDSETFGTDGKTSYYLYSRTGRKVSPLVIFFPGVFGNPASGSSVMVGRQLRRARNHVVILPNPWGSVFQRARPNFMPGDFEAEARAMVRMAKHAIARIGPDRISRVEFLGESYGGFLAPVTAAVLSQTGDFDVRSVTSVSVPYHVGNAISAIDKLADENEDAFFEQGCRWKIKGIFRLVGFAYELLLNHKDVETYARKSVGCSSAIFAYVGFQQPLYALAEDLSRRTRNADWPKDAGEEWRRKLRFRDFGNLFFGRDTIQIISRDSANLGYWTGLLNRRGIETRALVAADDPLNPPPGVGTQRVILSYEKDDLLVLSSGGHLGFRGEGRYRRLLRAQYDAKNEGEGYEETEGTDEDFDNSPMAGTGEDLDGDAEEAI